MLRALLREPVVLVFDYDGTLSPIAKRPSQAKLPVGTANLLVKLCDRYPVALLTGRARADIVDKVAMVPFRDVIGNHGAEWVPALRSYPAERALARQWTKTLRKQLDDIPGLQVENKGLTLSVHCRNVPNRAFYLPRITEAVNALPKVRVITGKQVFNLVPKKLPHKGDAVKQLIKQTRSRAALYLGDDITDEDVFEMRDKRVLGVHVGHTKTVATWEIPSQRQINKFLRLLLSL